MPGQCRSVGGDSGITGDMRERRLYNADDAEVGGHGNGH